MSSPCRMDMFLLRIRSTNVDGPVRAAVTDLESPIPLAAGTIEPSDAQFSPAWVSVDGGNGCIFAIVMIYASARDFLTSLVVINSTSPIVNHLASSSFRILVTLTQFSFAFAVQFAPLGARSLDLKQNAMPFVVNQDPI